jgi:hypothetical protein
MNLEMGWPSDVSAVSFVDEGLHGSCDAVKEVQRVLMEDAKVLLGRKVLLCKAIGDGKVFYDMYLQDDDGGPGMMLGRTSSQLTIALLDVLWKKGYSLPTRIRNLRIAGVVTLTAGEETAARIPDPWNTSRFWLGCALVGTGDFKTFKPTGDKK